MNIESRRNGIANRKFDGFPTRLPNEKRDVSTESANNPVCGFKHPTSEFLSRTNNKRCWDDLFWWRSQVEKL